MEVVIDLRGTGEHPTAEQHHVLDVDTDGCHGERLIAAVRNTVQRVASEIGLQVASGSNRRPFAPGDSGDAQRRGGRGT